MEAGMSLLDSSFEILSGNGHNKGLRLNVTLFRRDDMKSVQILEEAACSDIDSSPSGDSRTIFFYGKNLAFSSLETGKMARSMIYGLGMSGAGFDRLSFQASISMSAKLPASGSEKGTNVACDAFLQPSRQDLIALSRISGFEFELLSINIEPHSAKDNQIRKKVHYIQKSE
jgi:hypothetical protein